MSSPLHIIAFTLIGLNTVIAMVSTSLTVNNIIPASPLLAATWVCAFIGLVFVAWCINTALTKKEQAAHSTH